MESEIDYYRLNTKCKMFQNQADLEWTGSPERNTVELCGVTEWRAINGVAHTQRPGRSECRRVSVQAPAEHRGGRTAACRERQHQ